MQCRRCGEHNMPGLTACFACGLPDCAAAPGPEEIQPGQFTPRVETANPLATPHRRQKQRGQQSEATRRRALLGAVLLGLLPGLAADQRGQTRLARGLAGVTILSLLLLPFTWGTPYYTWPIMLIHSAIITAAVSEAAHRKPYPRPYSTISAFVLSITLLMTAHAGLTLLLYATLQPVFTPNLQGVVQGRVLTHPVAVPRLGTLVVSTGGQGYTTAADVLAPIVALPGQHVDVQYNRPIIDGSLTTVSAFGRTNVNLLRQPFVVPEDHVVLYASPLKPVPTANVRELFYRWTPAQYRGPFVWPLQAPEAP